MTDDVRNIVLGVVAAGISAALGWLTRTYLWKRKLRRKQRFFGLPDNSECVLVVNRSAGSSDWTVARRDVFALLELSAIIKDCGAHAQIVAHDAMQQGFGERTEFCIGGPYSNQRMAAHLRSLLPGVEVNTDTERGPDQGAIRVGSELHRWEKGTVEHVLLARLTADQSGPNARPVFLASGQHSNANHAAVRYLARNHGKLLRKYGNSSFVLLLKVVNSQAYGPDVVELVGDVTRTAQAPAPTTSAPGPSHRAS
ncbi:hypothetical protein [Streptomyces jeddahensis]|uniref:Secreted protein n=1 Tax=Streptomyces jeddahensis TaxID=1716141 RepID=A0A177HMT3_9ACTN|nr:hypothetical protein [Streptomyces jeddahensis]OAH11534.1 hypothetical protein STSP_52070 [Streptomyces jeddahensis]